MKLSTSLISFAGIVILLLSTLSTQAQAPYKISSQIVIRDASGELVSDSPVQIRISINQGSPQGFGELQEVHNVTTNVNGLASFEIGAGTWVFGFIESIDWSTGPYFIQTEVDPTNSSNYTISSTTELLSVPYALYANEAGNATFTNSGTVTSNALGDYATDDFVFGSPALDNDGDFNHDSRMFFDKSKGAFRVGDATGAEWDAVNVGIVSTAIGRNTTASGSFSIALGRGTTAPSYATTVIGTFNKTNAGQSSNEWIPTDHLFVIGNGQYSTTRSNAMVVLKNGNVGFGTSTPNELLEIAGDGRAFFGDGEDDNRKGLLIDGIQGAGAARIEAFDYGTGTGLNLVLNTATSGGNVGIRTNNPTATLSVNGSANKSGGGSWAVFSDRRLKKDIRSYEDGLSAVLAIDPVTFKYNSISEADTINTYVGVIAQELEKVSPYMINTVELKGTEYLEVDNSAMTYMLINAIKELNTTIEVQNAVIDDLKNENSELRADSAQHLEVIAANTKLLQELNGILKAESKR